MMKKGPEVLFVADSFGSNRHIGGPSNSRWDVVASLARSEAKLTILSGEDVKIPDWAHAHIGPEVEWLVPPDKKTLGPLINAEWLRSLPSYISSAVNYSVFARRVRKQQPDIIWAEGQESHRQMQAFKSWQVEKKVICVRGPPEQVLSIYAHDDYQIKRCFGEIAAYTHFATVSKNVGDLWHEIPEFAHLKMLYLPNCAREELLSNMLKQQSKADARRRLGFADDEFVMVYPASVQFRKGHDILVDHWPAISKLDDKLKCVCLGALTSGWSRFVLNKEVHDKGYQDRLILAGHQLNVLDYIHAADLIVFPSREEGMPIAILEAMVLGTPVVGSDTCGIPELIEDGEEGLLFTVDDGQGMVDKIAAVVQDRSLLEKFRRAAQEKYWSTFAREHHMKRYAQAVMEVYED